MDFAAEEDLPIARSCLEWRLRLVFILNIHPSKWPATAWQRILLSDNQLEKILASRRRNALNHLLNTARPAVVRLGETAHYEMVSGKLQLFGDINSLFVSLWRAGPESTNEDGDSDESENLSDDQILNDTKPEKVVTYSWLDSGADVVLDTCLARGSF
jgi:hypothetical protein